MHSVKPEVKSPRIVRVTDIAARRLSVFTISVTPEIRRRINQITDAILQENGNLILLENGHYLKLE